MIKDHWVNNRVHEISKCKKCCRDSVLSPSDLNLRSLTKTTGVEYRYLQTFKNTLVKLKLRTNIKIEMKRFIECRTVRFGK